MKIVIDFGPVLGWKVHELTEIEIATALGRHPFYRGKVFMWVETESSRDEHTCVPCAYNNIENNGVSNICAECVDPIEPLNRKLVPVKLPWRGSPEWHVS